MNCHLHFDGLCFYASKTIFLLITHRKCFFWGSSLNNDILVFLSLNISTLSFISAHFDRILVTDAEAKKKLPTFSTSLFRLDRGFHELYIPNQFSYIY